MGGYWSSKKDPEENSEKKKKKRKRGAEPDGHEGKRLLVANPYVLKRTGSMFFDEDGDLAHEFYCEERTYSQSGPRWSMRQIVDNLRPQGEVDLLFPRLHVDFPIVLMEVVSSSVHTAHK